MRRAFTLVELLVVIVIAVIVMAVALPTVKYAMEDVKVREAARQVNGFFAAAKAQAAATGRPAGVWLELERIGDPAAALGAYRCTQLYLAEVPPPYSGDTLNAICLIRQAGPPWQIDFGPAAAALAGLIEVGETFQIQLDFKGHWYTAVRTAGGFQIIPDSSGRVVPNQPHWYGADGAPGTRFTDDDGNGVIDDPTEWGQGDDAPQSIYAKYKVSRRPRRVGQPLELPQGAVIDMAYSGLGPDGFQFQWARERVLIMFSAGGGVASVSLVNQLTGAIDEDTERSKVFLLIGDAAKLETGPAFTGLDASNLADGSNFWVAINRRNGSVATVENVPDFNPQSYSPPQPYPPVTPQQRLNFLARAREFAVKGDVKGGQ